MTSRDGHVSVSETVLVTKHFVAVTCSTLFVHMTYLCMIASNIMAKMTWKHRIYIGFTCLILVWIIWSLSCKSFKGHLITQQSCKWFHYYCSIILHIISHFNHFSCELFLMSIFAHGIAYANHCSCHCSGQSYSRQSLLMTIIFRVHLTYVNHFSCQPYIPRVNHFSCQTFLILIIAHVIAHVNHWSCQSLLMSIIFHRVICC